MLLFLMETAGCMPIRPRRTAIRSTKAAPWTVNGAVQTIQLGASSGGASAPAQTAGTWKQNEAGRWYFENADGNPPGLPAGTGWTAIRTVSRNAIILTRKDGWQPTPPRPTVIRSMRTAPGRKNGAVQDQTDRCFRSRRFRLPARSERAAEAAGGGRRVPLPAEAVARLPAEAAVPPTSMRKMICGADYDDSSVSYSANDFETGQLRNDDRVSAGGGWQTPSRRSRKNTALDEMGRFCQGTDHRSVAGGKLRLRHR